jgi:hypothetical protein
MIMIVIVIMIVMLIVTNDTEANNERWLFWDYSRHIYKVHHRPSSACWEGGVLNAALNKWELKKKQVSQREVEVLWNAEQERFRVVQEADPDFDNISKYHQFRIR